MTERIELVLMVAGVLVSFLVESDRVCTIVISVQSLLIAPVLPSLLPVLSVARTRNNIGLPTYWKSFGAWEAWYLSWKPAGRVTDDRISSTILFT